MCVGVGVGVGVCCVRMGGCMCGQVKVWVRVLMVGYMCLCVCIGGMCVCLRLRDNADLKTFSNYSAYFPQCILHGFFIVLVYVCSWLCNSFCDF